MLHPIDMTLSYNTFRHQFIISPNSPIFLHLVLTFLPLRFLSESARWLLAKGRVKEAEDVIRKVGRWNGIELPNEIFDEKEGIDEYKVRPKSNQPNFVDLWAAFYGPHLKILSFGIDRL